MAARVAKLLGVFTSPDTLIRRQRQESFHLSAPNAVGVDEFSLRRGSSYGTLLVNMERHRPIDVVEDRRAAPLAHWLSAHPGIRVLARDRVGAYALAGRTAAPNTLQVADRFHLVRNVGDAFKELLRSRRWSLPDCGGEPATGSGAQQAALPTASLEGPTRKPQPTPLKRSRWEAGQKRKDTGQSIKGIAMELGINRKTVRKYLAADRPPSLPTPSLPLHQTEPIPLLLAPEVGWGVP